MGVAGGDVDVDGGGNNTVASARGVKERKGREGEKERERDT